MADYYTTLGVARDASDDDLKKAYRKQAIKVRSLVPSPPDAGASLTTWYDV